MRGLLSLMVALASSTLSYAQDKKAVPDQGLVGEWKVSLTLDSEPAKPVELGYTRFFRAKVADDGTVELFGRSDSSRAEYRHRDFTAVGTLGAASKEGVMALDLRFDRQGKGSVVWPAIAKRDGAVLTIALGRAWGNTRPKSFDDVTAAARKEDGAKHATLIVLGVDKK